MRKSFLLLFFCLSLMGLAACGIKAGALDPPSGDSAPTFPSNYPNPSTDPGAK